MKKFIIPGNPTDYYVALKNDSGVTEFSALRGKIRKLVEVYSECIRDVISSGGNPHTASLDYSDVFKEFLSNEPIEAQAVVLEVYAQESEAAASTSMDKVDELYEEAAKRNDTASMFGKFIGAIILLIVVVAFILH
ncbi:hypothetical protein V2154_10490 [Ewingella sp. CoE-038-23]|uniref:hypothetical protein n=1 Tax=Ewingella docleensis TaxID=3118588 RepID=UPI0033659F0F